MSEIHSSHARPNKIGNTETFAHPLRIGDALKYLRERTGTTLEFLQVKTRIPHSRLVEIEQGDNPLPNEVLLIHNVLSKRKVKKK